MMRITHSKRLDIEIFDRDFDVMREIVRLARERLNESPVVQLRGCGGLERQAGITTGMLLGVRETIDQLAKAVGLPPFYTYVDEPEPITFYPIIKR